MFCRDEMCLTFLRRNFSSFKPRVKQFTNFEIGTSGRVTFLFNKTIIKLLRAVTSACLTSADRGFAFFLVQLLNILHLLVFRPPVCPSNRFQNRRLLSTEDDEIKKCLRPFQPKYSCLKLNARCWVSVCSWQI